MAPRAIQTQTSRNEVLATSPSGASPSSEMRGAGAMAGAAYEGIAKFGDQLADIGTEMMKPEMVSRGAQAVTRDPTTGELTVELRTPLNDLDVAYNHAAQTSFLSQSAGDARLALQKLALENADDPDKFRAVATSYVKALAGGKGVPTELRGDILNDGMQDVVHFTGRLSSEKQTRDVRRQLGDTKLGIEREWNDVFALANRGGTDSPEFKTALAKARNLYSGLRNPVFGVSDAEIEAEISEKISMAEGEALVGSAVSHAKRDGLQAGLDFVDQAIWDRKLELSPAQREAYASRAKREIGEWNAIQRDALVEQKQRVESLYDDAEAEALGTGKITIITPDEVMRANADNPWRGRDILSKLEGAKSQWSMRQQLRLATPQAEAEMERRLNPANSPQQTKSDFDAFHSGFLAKTEGGFAASDGGGGPVNFGVNQDANPDIDVKSLTADKAKAILKERYWNASGAEQLPPALAAVQGDTAVNMGVGASKELLAQSGGDPQKYLELREARYRDIAAKSPEKAKSLPVWLKRNEDLRAYIASVGYADAARNYGAFQEARQAKRKALTEDPSGYVQANRTDIAAMLQSEDPETFQRGIRESMRAQRDLGAMAPTVLGKGHAAAIVQSFANPEDPAKRADHMLGIMGGLEQRYGKFFPQAMAELQKAGIPAEALALAQVRDDPAVRGRMAVAVNMGRETLKKGLGDTSAIDKSLAGALTNFNRTLIGYPDGAKIAATQAQAVQIYAYQYALEGEANPGRRAVQDIIGKRYTFANTYRVPAGVDSGQVGRASTTLLRNLKAESLLVTAEMGGFAPGTTDATKRDIAARTLRSQGVWVTLPDDSGLALRWPQSTGYIAARGANGKPITYTWGQLRQVAPEDVSLVPAPVL